MRIFQNARSPMPRGHMRHIESAIARALPPVKFDNLRKSEIGDQIGHMRRNDDGRRCAALPQRVLHNGTQRWAMKMIEVRVRDQHEINGWKVGDTQSRTT